MPAALQRNPVPPPVRAAVSVNNLHVRFGKGETELRALSDLSVQIPEGALVTKKIGAMTQEEIEGVINKKTNGKQVGAKT